MNSKTERSASPKVMKTRKQITSKIDSGVSKKSSTLTLIKSRQPSTASRTSSKQSIDEKKPSGIPTSRSRPATSFSSSRFSQSSKLSIVDDKLQQGVHKLGQLPSYLRGNRPSTAVSKLKTTESETRRILDKGNEDSEAVKKVLEFDSMRFEKFRNNLSQQYGSYANSKAALDGIERKSPLKRDKIKEPHVSSPAKATDLEQAMAKICTETDQIDSGIQVGCTPCEGEGSGDAALQQAVLLRKELELSEVHGKVRQLEEKCDRLEADCNQKRERILELETVLAAIKEREHDFEKNKGKVRTLSAQIEDLKAKLVEAGNTLEDREKQLFESEEKEAEKEMEAFRQQSEELSQRINLLTQEIADKDATIATLTTGDPTETVETELQAHRTEVDALQEEVRKLRFENNMLVSVKKQDDILLQIRSKLLESLERSKEMFKARCEEMTGDGEIGVASRVRAEGFDILFETLSEKQRQCCKEEQIIGEIEQNNQKCKTERNKLLEMLKRLKKENRQMREIMNNSGPDVLTECYDESTRDDSHLKGQLLDHICQLFPEEPSLQEPTVELDNVEEEILSRINYDNEQISSEHTRDAESR
ncbi:ERC protein 2-like [Ochlerotatus camptorhynchus]|uniref:ERC protein 2-like n=1 Tax=Ochlerotatus camptorhynchus TaxID=644619 RepID=UPI0031DA5628